MSVARVVLTLALVTAITATGKEKTSDWPSFRGPQARGIADGFATPTRWDVASGKNILWKTPIPGLAHSSPVVCGNRVFVTTATTDAPDPELKLGLYGDIEPVTGDTAHRFELYALDKRSGEVLWQRTAHQGLPRVKRHPKSSHANPTPVCAGDRVVAFYGSEGLFAYDTQGRLLWKKDLGVLDAAFFVAPEAQWGFASSPVIHDGKLIVLADVLNGSFLAAFDLEDGEELWRTTRGDVPTWGTPTVHATPSRTQIIVNGFKHAGGYDVDTGKELWRIAGGGDIPVPTPFVAHDLVFLSSAHGGSRPLFAVRTSANGDVSLEAAESSNAHVAWSRPRDGAYIPTPIVYGDVLYVLRDNGVLSAYDARTGERHYQERLGAGRGGVSASVVAADGKLYLTGETGEVAVVRAGTEYELLETNGMGETCMATPAISEGVLYFRTRGRLVAIAGTDAPK